MPLSIFEGMRHTQELSPRGSRPCRANGARSIGRLPSVWAIAKALAPTLEVGPETLRKWFIRAQVVTGQRSGATSAELEENKRLQRENRDLKETNEMMGSVGATNSSVESRRIVAQLFAFW